MAHQTCPRCGARFPDDHGWAKTAISLLVAAPAVRDMATQVRCPTCQYVFAEGEVRYLNASGAKGARATAWLVIAAAFVWAVYQLFAG
jgi:uncharacterized C2H2 Zn-finger protein